jgi:hypothetical protein
LKHLLNIQKDEVMDLVDRKAVLGAIRLGMTVTQLEREIMAIPGVAVVPLADLFKAESRIRQLEEAQHTNPNLAELIEANKEIKRLRKELVRQHVYFTGKDVPDLIVTTGTDYEEINHEDDHPR